MIGHLETRSDMVTVEKFMACKLASVWSRGCIIVSLSTSVQSKSIPPVICHAVYPIMKIEVKKVQTFYPEWNTSATYRSHVFLVISPTLFTAEFCLVQDTCIGIMVVQESMSDV